MITRFKIFEKLSNELFQIPKEIESFYDITGNMANARNWKAKIIVGNTLGKGKKVGDWDKVGYVLISLTSNYIIPISRSDEHHNGYDLLEYLINKYKIKNLIYECVYLLGNTFVYGGEYHDKEIKAIKKAYEYGARDIIVKKMGEKNKCMSINEFVENDGDFNKAKKNAKKLKKVSTESQNFIDNLLEIIKLFEQYRTNPLRQNVKTADNIVNACKRLDKLICKNDILSDILIWDDDKNKKIYKSFEHAIEMNDLDTIDRCLFDMSGIKNIIHMLLRKNNKNIEEFFWSNENALEQFNAISNIKM